MTKKTIGIIGGMGPLATADLFNKIVLNTVADRDQDHLRVVIDNNPAIPDRTAALLDGGEDPLPALLNGARNLISLGADMLLIPCNTAHGFYDKLVGLIDVPVIHMVDSACEEMERRGVKKAGLLATNGCVRAGIYQHFAANHGVELLLPTETEQKAIHELIYRGVKPNDPDYDAGTVRAVAERLIQNGAEAVILGCTELPLAWPMYGLCDIPHIDPTLILARKAVSLAGGELKK